MTEETNHSDHQATDVISHIRKVCKKCGVEKYKNEFAWMKNRMQRKVNCRDCTKQPKTVIEPAEPVLITFAEATAIREDALKNETEEAINLAADEVSPYHGNPVAALEFILKPKSIPMRYVFSGLPRSLSIRQLKGYMLIHAEDTDVLPLLAQSYKQRQADVAATMRKQRANRKDTRFTARGGRSCEQCGKPIENTAHVRKKFCNSNCRKAFSRANVTQNV